MELRHLRCFLAVAEEIHFARAFGIVVRPLAGSPPMLITYLLRRGGEPFEMLARFIEHVASILVISGIGQSLFWTAMWVVAASGMASTALNVGNAIGIALLVAFANRGVGGLQGEALRDGLAVGSQHAFYLASAGLLLGLLVSLALPRGAVGHVQAGAA